ncbi:MAG: hypothetical protein MUE73_20710 [Planctomycetes bacterium]|nr:hypothetical protein [Planctomycetota bacterium]
MSHFASPRRPRPPLELDPATSAGTLFVSAAGFTHDFRALARKRGDIRLLSLGDLRAG